MRSLCRLLPVIALLLMARFAFAAGSVSADEALNTLRLDASRTNTTAYCNERFLQGQADSVNGAVQRAEFMNAQAAALVLAGTLAKCGLKENSAALPQVSQRVGEMLALSAISASRAGVLTTEAVATAKRAEVLLIFADQNGSPYAAKMLRLLHEGGFGEQVKAADTNAGAVPTSVALKATSKAVAEKFAANGFAFKQQYSGKFIEATGPVRGIFESKIGGKTGALVILTGIPRASVDDVSLRDELECQVTSSDALQRAVQIQAKQIVAIRGTYDPSKDPMISRIVLHDCQIN